MKDKKRVAIIIVRRGNTLICHNASLAELDLAALLLCPGARRKKKQAPLGEPCLLCSYRLIPGVALMVIGRQW